MMAYRYTEDPTKRLIVTNVNGKTVVKVKNTQRVVRMN